MLRKFGVMRGATVLGLGGLVAIAAAPTVAHADIDTQPIAARPAAPFHGALARTGPNGGGTSTPTPTASCGKFPYDGGPVISNVKVVAVFWTSAVDSLVKTTMPGFFSTITASPFLDMLSEYSTTGQSGGTGQTVGRGSLVTSVTITPMVETGATVQDTKIGTELAAQISAGVLPAVTFDAEGYPDTLFFLFFPVNVSVVQGGAASCTSWCGYHSSYTASGKQVPYAVIPDMSPSSECSSGCGGGTEANFVESTSAHELAEAITDTAVGSGDYAWSGSGGTDCSEIGDVCATGSSSDQATVDGYTVQKVWSNVLNECAADNPNITVAGCTSSATCSAPTAVCNTTTGTCVQCGSSSDCSASTPVCNTTAGTCGPCTSNSQCTNASDPVCNTSAGTCGPASTPTPDAGSSGSPDASTGGSPDASTGGGSDGGSTGLHDASTGGGSDSGSSYGGYGDDSGSTGTGGNQADGGTGSGDNGSGWSDDNGTGSSGGCSMSSSSNDVSYSGLGIACVAGAMLAARSRRSKRR